jgi:hypothetical protein
MTNEGKRGKQKANFIKSQKATNDFEVQKGRCIKARIATNDIRARLATTSCT